MGRIIAIDYGARRTGLAWTDPMKLIANGVGSFDTDQIPDKLRSIVKMEEVEAIVIGMPVRFDGSDTHSTELVREFIIWLKKEFPVIPIIEWDERFTSKEAQQVMLQAGVKKKKRKEKHLINQISATLILQDYLSSHSQ